MLLEDDDDVPPRGTQLFAGTQGRQRLSRTHQQQQPQQAAARLSQSTSRLQLHAPLQRQHSPSGVFVSEEEVLRNMRSKMESASTDIGWIIRRCQGIDANLDGVIYVEDFLRIFQEECSVHNQLTRRELNALTTHLSLVADPNRIRYTRLREFVSNTRRSLDQRATGGHQTRRQISGFEDTAERPSRAVGDQVDDYDRWNYDDDHGPHADVQPWAVQSGSVGEWLFKKACPAERRNFVKLIEALERFEAQTGMQITRNETTGDLVVPLGPALRAKIEFVGV